MSAEPSWSAFRAHVFSRLDAIDRARFGYGSEDRFTHICPVCRAGHGEHLLIEFDGEAARAWVHCSRGCTPSEIAEALGVDLDERDRVVSRSLDGEPPEERIAVVVRTVQEFADLDEPAAAALLGSDENALIPEGGDVMFYGNGGAGKTTLAFDLAFHLATGRDWIGIPVRRAVRVLLIENEGPRPLLRRKLRRKLAAWDGELDDRLRVYEQPWGQFTIAAEPWREKLAREIAESEIDVLIAGPLTRIGMDEAGTLQEVRAFTELVEDVRRQCARSLAVILVHHQNKAGAVSGAWEAAGDTLLHVQAAGNGHTVVFVQKARWDTERTQTTLKLAWTDGESFQREGDRNYLAEIEQLLSDGRWRTAKQIAVQTEGGIGANLDTVKELVKENSERFEPRTGDDAKALGRHPSAILWGLLGDPSNPSKDMTFEGEDGEVTRCFSLKGKAPVESPRLPGLDGYSGPGVSNDNEGDAEDADVERAEQLRERWGESVEEPPA